MTEFKSRRELREAERQGLVPKPEQVFDLPTGSIAVPNLENTVGATQTLEPVSHERQPHDIASAAEMLTRRRIREMERDGSLDPLTGAVPIPVSLAGPVATNQAVLPEDSAPSRQTFDEILAESEEPITSSVNIVSPPAAAPSVAAPAITAPTRADNIGEPTDIFHNMAVDLNSRKPRKLIWALSIVLVLATAAAGAYMLGIFK